MSIITQVTTVYGGPHTSAFASLGTLNANQQVTAIFKEGTFVFVEYLVSGQTKRRGYVPSNKVNIQESVATYSILSAATRITNRFAYVYGGPGFSGYATVGSFTENAFIQYLGVKENGFALVEMKTSGGRIRGYFYANYLGTLSSRENTIVSDTSTAGYKSPLNKFTSGQCTWYCWGRAYEKCGAQITFSGGQNGNQWYANVSGGYKGKYPASHGPVANSVCSCTSAAVEGHVLFIEAVEDNYVYFTEDHWADTDPALRKMSISAFEMNRHVIGYIAV